MRATCSGKDVAYRAASLVFAALCLVASRASLADEAPPVLKIIGACKSSPTCGADVNACRPEAHVSLEPGDRLVLCLEYNAGTGRLGKDKLSLILNGQSFAKRSASFVRAALDAKGVDVLEFRLPGRLEDDWQAFIRSTPVVSVYENVPVAVAFEGRPVSLLGDPVKTRINLVVYDKTLYVSMVIILLIFMGATLLLANSTNVLRDRGFGLPPMAKPPFSLARCQVAFWFVLVFASFAWLWVVTGSYANVLNDTALVLIGIGTGTALGGFMIDATNVSESEAAVKPLLAREAALSRTLREAEAKLAAATPALQNALRASPPPADLAQLQKAAADEEAVIIQAKADLLAVTKEIDQKAPKVAPRVSEGWWKDVVTDKSGVSFHRFQMISWTVLLGLVFLWSVLNDLAMPTFNNTLLALLGISAGTYLGFKLPEKHA